MANDAEWNTEPELIKQEPLTAGPISPEKNKLLAQMTELGNQAKQYANRVDNLPPSVRETIEKDKKTIGERATQNKLAGQVGDEAKKWVHYWQDETIASKASQFSKAEKNSVEAKELLEFVVNNVPEALWEKYGVPSSKIVEKGKHFYAKAGQYTDHPVNDFLRLQDEFLAEENKTPEQRDLEQKIRESSEREERERQRAETAERLVNEQTAENERLRQELAEIISRNPSFAQNPERLTELEAENLELRDQIEQERINSERRAGRVLWWASAAVGAGVGLTAELTGQGWWFNPIMRGVTTAAGLGAVGLDLGATALERRGGNGVLEDRLGRFRNVARTVRTVASGAGAGIAAVSLGMMAGHLISEGTRNAMQFVTDRFLNHAPDITNTGAQALGKVGEPVTQQIDSSWLSKLDIKKSAWGTVHDMINNHQAGNIELWKAPTGNNSADVIAQWSTKIFPHVNNAPVDLIQPGSLDLVSQGRLDALQMDFLKRLSETKSYNEYVNLVREFAGRDANFAKIPEVVDILKRK